MKKAIAILAIVVALIVAAAVLLPRYLNPERYRPQIEAALHEATGWKVSLGEIKLQLFGGATIRIRPAELSDPATGFRTEVKTLRIRVELKPLLKGTLAIRKIDLIKPAITLLWTEEGLQLPSLPRKTGGSAGTAGEEDRRGPQVTIARVEIRNGSLTVRHQLPKASSIWALTQVSGSILPGARRLKLSGRVGEGGLSVTSALGGPTTIAFEGLRPGDLPPWLVQDLLRPGSFLSGTLDLAPGVLRIEGRVLAKHLALLDGQAPLKKAELRLSIARKPHGWELRSFRMKALGGTLEASGSLAPKLDLGIEFPLSPVEAAMAIARALYPVPAELKGPGQVRGIARIRRSSQGTLTATASGTISAAVLRSMTGLPPIRQVRVKFRYEEDGRLKITSLRGVLAGGGLQAKAGLAPLSPPGTLSIKAKLQGSDLRRLLLSFGVPHAREIAGSAAAEATLRTDLSSGVPGPAGLRGKVTATVTDLRIPGWDLVATVTAQLGKGGSWKDMLHVLGSSGATRKGGRGHRASFDKAQLQLVMNGLPWRVSGLELDSPELEARGSGTFDPVRGTVRLQLKLRLDAALSAKLVGKASFLSSLRDGSGRLVIPTIVRGPVTSPSISVDLESALSGDRGLGGLLKSFLGGGE